MLSVLSYLWLISWACLRNLLHSDVRSGSLSNMSPTCFSIIWNCKTTDSGMQSVNFKRQLQIHQALTNGHNFERDLHLGIFHESIPPSGWMSCSCGRRDPVSAPESVLVPLPGDPVPDLQKICLCAVKMNVKGRLLVNRVFYDISTTEEWQYCQLCFNSAIRN